MVNARGCQLPRWYTAEQPKSSTALMANTAAAHRTAPAGASAISTSPAMSARGAITVCNQPRNRGLVTAGLTGGGEGRAWALMGTPGIEESQRNLRLRRLRVCWREHPPPTPGSKLGPSPTVEYKGAPWEATACSMVSTNAVYQRAWTTSA